MDLLSRAAKICAASPAVRVSMRFWVWPMTITLAAMLALASYAKSPALLAQESTKLEYQVKAAFLLNFAKFVEWPSRAFVLPTDPIVICVVGRDPFGSSLNRIVSGERIQSRDVSTRYLPVDGSLSSCHILYISSAEQKRYMEILKMVRDSSVLTVGEVPGFSDHGGMIEFVIDQEKLQFFINSAAVDTAGLKVSSRLLRVARQVKNTGS
jgi:hypothetical protein